MNTVSTQTDNKARGPHSARAAMINVIRQSKLINRQTAKNLPLKHLSDDFIENIAPQIVWCDVRQGYLANEVTYRAAIFELEQLWRMSVLDAAAYADATLILSIINKAHKIASGDISLKLDMLREAFDDYANKEVLASFS